MIEVSIDQLTGIQRLVAAAEVPEAWAEHVAGVAGSRLETHFDEVCVGCRDLRNVLLLGRPGSHDSRVKDAVRLISGTTGRAYIGFLINEGG